MPATLFYLSYRALIYLSIVMRMRILENIHMREQNFHSHMYATWLSFTNKLQIHCSAHEWTDIFGVRSGTKSILRFCGLGNTSSLRKLFFDSLVPRRSLLIRCPREVWKRAGERTPSRPPSQYIYIGKIPLILAQFYPWSQTSVFCKSCSPMVWKFQEMPIFQLIIAYIWDCKS